MRQRGDFFWGAGKIVTVQKKKQKKTQIGYPYLFVVCLVVVQSYLPSQQLPPTYSSSDMTGRERATNVCGVACLVQNLFHFKLGSGTLRALWLLFFSAHRSLCVVPSGSLRTICSLRAVCSSRDTNRTTRKMRRSFPLGAVRPKLTGTQC